MGKHATPTERSISAAELTARLDGALEEVRRDGVVFQVDLGPRPDDWWGPRGMIDRDGHVRLALGPPDVCNAIGLVDAEYGWPYDVPAEAADLAPRISPTRSEA